VERVRLGLLKRGFNLFAEGYLSFNLLNLALPREKIAVSEAEKKAERKINRTNRIILAVISL